MTINFPEGLDTFPDPTPTTKRNAVGFGHALAHTDVGNAVEEVEKLLVGPVWVNVKGHGAVGDWVTDDTAAIQAAINAAGALQTTMTPTGSGQVSSVVTVFFSEGHYKITAPLVWTAPGLSYTRIVGDQAIIEQATAATDIFDLRGTIRHEIRGIIFVEGRKHVVWGNNNVNASQLFFYRCEFHNSEDWAIDTTLTGAWGTVGNMSANLVIEDCKFQNVNRVLHNVAGLSAHVKTTWVEVDGSTVTTAALFQNDNELNFDKMYGVPPPSSTPVNLRWVDNYGQFFAKHSRFGGEGSGIPTVRHFAAPENVYPYTLGGVVSIKDSFIAIGTASGGRDRYLIHLAGEIPQVIDLTGNFGITRDSNAIITDGTGGIDTYIAGKNSNVIFWVNITNNLAHSPLTESSVPAQLVSNSRVRWTPNLRFSSTWSERQTFTAGIRTGSSTGTYGVNVRGADANDTLSGILFGNAANSQEWAWIAGTPGVANNELCLRNVTAGTNLIRVAPGSPPSWTLAMNFGHQGTTAGFFSATPVTQRAFIAAPSGGGTVDAEARTAINSIRQVLIDLGFKASS